MCGCHGTASQVFIDDVTADRRSTMISDVHRAKLFAQIPLNAAKVTGLHSGFLPSTKDDIIFAITLVCLITLSL